MSQAFEPTLIQGITHIVETAIPEHDIFFLKARAGYRSARLIGNTFIPIEEEFPTGFDHNSIIATPDDEVIGIGGFLGQRTAFRLNTETDRFEEMPIDSPHDLDSVRDITWSTPMDAALLTGGGNAKAPDRGAVLILRDDKVERLQDLPYWVTQVTDFPELQLTVLVSEATDRVYIIDADRTLHELAELDLGDWRFISRTLYLADPPRLLLEANEAYGSFRGLFLIQLDRLDGIWRPAKTQDWSNLMEGFPDLNHERLPNGRRAYDPEGARYFFYGQKYGNHLERLLGRVSERARAGSFGLYQVGANGLEKIDEANQEVFNSLPKRMQSSIDPTLGPQLFSQRRIRMSSSGAIAVLSNETIQVVEVDGTAHELDRSVLGPAKFRALSRTWALDRRGEVLMWSNEAFYLLRDRTLSGQDAFCGCRP